MCPLLSFPLMFSTLTQEENVSLHRWAENIPGPTFSCDVHNHLEKASSIYYKIIKQMEFASVLFPSAFWAALFPTRGSPRSQVWAFSVLSVSWNLNASKFHQLAALLGEFDVSLAIRYAWPGTFSLVQVFSNEALWNLTVPLGLPQRNLTVPLGQPQKC